ncbi:MAG: hypothetical protein ABI333_15070 [bacterium]
MPPKSPELTDKIEEILREAAAKIVALMEDEQEAMLESVHHALSALDMTIKGRANLPEALRMAAGGRLRKRAGARTGRSSKRPPRDQWVKTADVVVRLRELLAERTNGARIGDLRRLTRYSDMQLHRALRELRDAGELVKEGELRKTVYRLVARGRPARTAKGTPKQAASRASTPRSRPPKSQWVTTDDVKRAVQKALRGRSRGLMMSELCTSTGYNDKQVYRAITGLVDDGAVTKAGTQRSMRYLLKTSKKNPKPRR